jgi:copper homeostasis protein
MKRRYILEISVESAEAAMAVERGGADRIELCSELAVGGLTPSEELMRAVRERVKLPVFAMIRPRAGDFVYREAEFEQIKREIATAKEWRMGGVVFGLLNSSGNVEVERTKQLVGLARPLPVTFHRAFDESVELRKSLEDVIETGAARLLTSGGENTAPQALEVLAELVQRAGSRLSVIPGSGIHAENIREVVKKTKAREYHAGLSSVVARPAENLEQFELAVRALAQTLASCG